MTLTKHTANMDVKKCVKYWGKSTDDDKNISGKIIMDWSYHKKNWFRRLNSIFWVRSPVMKCF